MPILSLLTLALLQASASPSVPAQASASPQAPPSTAAPARPAGETARPAPTPQPRPSATRVAVPISLVSVDDGDTVQIRWPGGDVEIVRLLGIDTPETRHIEHDIPYDQAFGLEARAFAQGAFAAATQIEVLRAKTLDPFGRSLGYAFVNGVNYSVLVVTARLAEESVTRYGDNGFPTEAAAVLAAAKAAGPLPFEPPATYRARMREVAKAMKARGEYPKH